MMAMATATAEAAKGHTVLRECPAKAHNPQRSIEEAISVPRHRDHDDNSLAGFDCSVITTSGSTP